MKVKLRFGLKNYSGTLDDLVFCDFGDRGTIGRMLPSNRQLTEHNVSMGSKMEKIASIYNVVSEGFKQDLELYSYKMYNLKDYRNTIRGNKYSSFVKMIWGASKDSENPSIPPKNCKHLNVR